MALLLFFISVVLEMLLGVLEFLLFHESTEVKKDVSLMDGYENGKHGGYGNEGSLCDAFLLFRDNPECFFPLRDKQSDEETCVDGSGSMW